MDIESFEQSLAVAVRSVGSSLWRRKLTFALVSSIVFVLLFSAALTLQPVYESSAVVLGGQGNIEQSPGSPHTLPETSLSLSRIAESDEVVRAAVERVGLPRLVPDGDTHVASVFARLRSYLYGDSEPADGSITQMDMALPAIHANLIVRAQPNSDVVSISFKSYDPVLARDFVNAVADELIDRHIALYSRPGATEFFLQQRLHFDEDSKKASEAWQAFSVESGIYSVDDQRQLLLNRLNDLLSALSVTQGAIAEKSGQRQALGEQLRKLAPAVRSPFVSSLLDDLAAGHAATASRLPAGEPQVADDRSSNLQTLMGKVYQDSLALLLKLNADLVGMRNLEQQQQASIEEAKQALNKLTVNEAKFVRLKQAVEEATANSKTLANRMVEEQIDAQSSAAKFSSLRVIQRGAISPRPVFPNYFVFSFAAALLSMVAAAALSVWLERTASRKPRSALVHSRSRSIRA